MGGHVGVWPGGWGLLLAHPHGDVGQARGPELEPSLGTIIGSRHKVQKGALGHSLPAAAVTHYREHADQGKACPGASLTPPPPGTHTPDPC